MKITGSVVSQIQQWDYNTGNVSSVLGFVIVGGIKVGIIKTTSGYRKFKIPKSTNLFREEGSEIVGYTTTWDGSSYPVSEDINLFVVKLDGNAIYSSKDLSRSDRVFNKVADIVDEASANQIYY